jgi:23S rRNA (cytidine2498-2'-O)-methyltransferase
MSYLNSQIDKVLIAPLKLENQLKQELEGISYSQEDLIFFVHDKVAKNWIWPNTVWLEPKILQIDSIKDAAKKLRAVFNGVWQSYSIRLHRRTKLIEENLKVAKLRRFDYMDQKLLPFAEWMLLDENTILYSIKNSSKAPRGQLEFNEDKNSPPSRAYLKLWETFTCHISPPTAEDIVMDLGACPGGWTWVLKNHAKQVISVDKAPLDKNIMAATNVIYIAKDAFKLSSNDVPTASWLLSDIACYPEKLLELIQYWLTIDSIKTFVCTVKLQDRYDPMVLKKLEDIHGSKLIHLYQNKNELTWILQR